MNMSALVWFREKQKKIEKQREVKFMDSAHLNYQGKRKQNEGAQCHKVVKFIF